jgi:hypothetical protein
VSLVCKKSYGREKHKKNNESKKNDYGHRAVAFIFIYTAVIIIQKI